MKSPIGIACGVTANNLSECGARLMARGHEDVVRGIVTVVVSTPFERSSSGKFNDPLILWFSARTLAPVIFAGWRKKGADAARKAAA